MCLGYSLETLIDESPTNGGVLFLRKLFGVIFNQKMKRFFQDFSCFSVAQEQVSFASLHR